MTLVRRPRTFVATLFASASLAAPALAVEAPEACGEVPCPRGYSCELIPLPCPGRACAEGEECPPCEPSSEPTCMPLPCSDHADCDPEMRCVTWEIEECTGGSAPCADPGDGREPACPEPEPEDCTTESVSQCVPRWALECASASDCGDGFTCEEQQACGCSGSGGTPAVPPSEPVPDSGEDPAPSEFAPENPDCTCEPTGEFACVAVEQACTSNAECPGGWTCGDNPNGSCWSGPEGSGCSADPEYVCLPPFWNLGGFRGGVSEDGSTATPGSDNSGSGEKLDADGGDEAKSDSGCAVASPGAARLGSSAVGLSGLAALALFGLSRRRRRTADRPRAR